MTTQSKDTDFTNIMNFIYYLLKTFRNAICMGLLLLWISTIHSFQKPITGNRAQAHMFDLMIILYILLPFTLILLSSFVIEYIFKKLKTSKEKIYTPDFPFPHFHQETTSHLEPNIYMKTEFKKNKDEDIDWKNLYDHTEKENNDLKVRVKRLEKLLNISNKAYYELQKFNT